MKEIKTEKKEDGVTEPTPVSDEPKDNASETRETEGQKEQKPE